MADGVIFKALSGFYYVNIDDETIRCKARGRFRHDKITPLVGDKVKITVTCSGEGIIDSILPRKNAFHRPPVANIDTMVIVVSGAIPITDPFLIDRMITIAEYSKAEPVICINKCDLSPADELYRIYSGADYITLRVSATNGDGIDTLSKTLGGKICAFTGNSGVGKSSILNMLDSNFNIDIGEISQKLGRGRHTTRHVELFKTGNGAIIADTPGFSAFDTENMELTNKDELQYCFREFKKYIPNCRFTGCSHIKEAGCAVLEALVEGAIDPSRHKSYVRLYDIIKQSKKWE